MKTILITGAAGFIGSHLAEFCLQQGLNVKAFVRYNSMNKKGWLEKSPCLKDIEIIAGDIRDYDSVYRAVKGCDTVFHLAALIGIPYSYVSPLAYIKTNVEGTYNVLEAGRQLEIENIIVTSTSEAYGTAQYVPIDEKHPLVGQSPYAASKIAADQLALSFFHSFGTPVKIVRPFNTYGPRQSLRAIIPTIITQIFNANGAIKLGNISPSRDFTFVKDTVSGILSVAQSTKLLGEATNIGMNYEISIHDLAKKIASLMNKKIEIAHERQRIRPKASEVERLQCANEKILQLTSWKPKYDLDKGLKETIKWLENNADNYREQGYRI